MKRSGCYPRVEELVPVPEPADVFQKLSSLPHCLFLDSALRHPVLGRYSFVAADPFAYLELPAEDADSLGALAARWRPWQREAAAVAGLPPFQGGAAGLVGYDLGRQLERLPTPAIDEFRVPALAVGFYDVVVAFDHVEGRAWIISQGLPELEPARRRQRAQRRLDQMRDWLARKTPGRIGPAQQSSLPPLRLDQLAPRHPG